MKFYKYQGAGNDFLIADNRDGSIVLSTEQIAALCDRRYGVGADGLMLLERPDSEDMDFRMTYFNSDGSGGMMCGNGGRCIVAFAADMGIKDFRFIAADGPHVAELLSDDGRTKTVRLQMKDVCTYGHYLSLTGVSVPSEGSFLDTGTRHFVRMVEGRQGIQISALEEIAYLKGWINKDKLLESAEKYGKSPYGQHLKRVAEGKIQY